MKDKWLRKGIRWAILDPKPHLAPYSCPKSGQKLKNVDVPFWNTLLSTKRLSWPCWGRRGAFLLGRLSLSFFSKNPVTYWTCANFCIHSDMPLQGVPQLDHTLHCFECGICLWCLMLLSSHIGRSSEWIPVYPCHTANNLIRLCHILPVACLLYWRIPVHLVVPFTAVILQLLLSLPLFSKPFLFPL